MAWAGTSHDLLAAEVAAEAVNYEILAAAKLGLMVKLVDPPLLARAWRRLYGQPHQPLPDHLRPFGRLLVVLERRTLHLARAEATGSVRQVHQLAQAMHAALERAPGSLAGIAVLARGPVLVVEWPTLARPAYSIAPAPAPATVPLPPKPAADPVRVRRRVRRHGP